jgi:hypothetical protein
MTGLILLSGLNFRQQPVLCAHCSWDGLAGELRSPEVAELTAQNQAETMSYACPECGQVIAIHKGLSTREVLQEMLVTRKILKDELSATRHQP